MTAVPQMDGQTPLPPTNLGGLLKKEGGKVKIDDINIWTGGKVDSNQIDGSIIDFGSKEDPFDVDRNGKIDEAEQAAKDAYEKAQEKMKFDMDGDGKLSDAELAAYDAFKKSGGKVEKKPASILDKITKDPNALVLSGTNDGKKVPTNILIDGPGNLKPEDIDVDSSIKDIEKKEKDGENITGTVLIDGPGDLKPEEVLASLKTIE